MARPKNLAVRVELHVRLLEPTLAKLNLICLDPFLGKLSYSVRNEHLEKALAEYFEKYFPMKDPQPENKA